MNFSRSWVILICMTILSGGAPNDIVKVDSGSGVNITWTLMSHERTSNLQSIRISRESCAKSPLLSCDKASSDCSDDFVIEPDQQDPDFVSSVGFRLSAVNLTMAGFYCMTIVVGKLSWNLTKVVYVFGRPTKPQIFGHIISPIAGEDFQLRCESSLTSQPSQYRNISLLHYHWYINRTNVTRDMSVYEFKEVNKSMDGSEIQCTVHESGSTIRSMESGAFKLRVRYIVDVRLLFDTNADETRLVCSADCNPACNYTWAHPNGTVIGKGSRLPPVEGWVNGKCTASSDADLKTKSTSTIVFYRPVKLPILLKEPVTILGAFVGSLGFIAFVAILYISCSTCRLRAEPPEKHTKETMFPEDAEYDVIPDVDISPRYQADPTVQRYLNARVDGGRSAAIFSGASTSGADSAPYDRGIMRKLSVDSAIDINKQLELSYMKKKHHARRNTMFPA